jgi:hypothetical protein
MSRMPDVAYLQAANTNVGDVHEAIVRENESAHPRSSQQLGGERADPA